MSAGDLGNLWFSILNKTEATVASVKDAEDLVNASIDRMQARANTLNIGLGMGGGGGGSGFGGFNNNGGGTSVGATGTPGYSTGNAGGYSGFDFSGGMGGGVAAEVDNLKNAVNAAQESARASVAATAAAVATAAASMGANTAAATMEIEAISRRLQVWRAEAGGLSDGAQWRPDDVIDAEWRPVGPRLLGSGEPPDEWASMPQRGYNANEDDGGGAGGATGGRGARGGNGLRGIRAIFIAHAAGAAIAAVESLVTEEITSGRDVDVAEAGNDPASGVKAALKAHQAEMGALRSIPIVGAPLAGLRDLYDTANGMSAADIERDMNIQTQEQKAQQAVQIEQTRTRNEAINMGATNDPLMMNYLRLQENARTEMTERAKPFTEQLNAVGAAEANEINELPEKRMYSFEKEDYVDVPEIAQIHARANAQRNSIKQEQVKDQAEQQQILDMKSQSELDAMSTRDRAEAMQTGVLRSSVSGDTFDAIRQKIAAENTQRRGALQADVTNADIELHAHPGALTMRADQESRSRLNEEEEQAKQRVALGERQIDLMRLKIVAETDDLNAAAQESVLRAQGAGLAAKMIMAQQRTIDAQAELAYANADFANNPSEAARLAVQHAQAGVAAAGANEQAIQITEAYAAQNQEDEQHTMARRANVATGNYGGLSASLDNINDWEKRQIRDTLQQRIANMKAKDIEDDQGLALTDESYEEDARKQIADEAYSKWVEAGEQQRRQTERLDIMGLRDQSDLDAAKIKNPGGRRAKQQQGADLEQAQSAIEAINEQGDDDLRDKMRLNEILVLQREQEDLKPKGAPFSVAGDPFSAIARGLAGHVGGADSKDEIQRETNVKLQRIIELLQATTHGKVSTAIFGSRG